MALEGMACRLAALHMTQDAVDTLLAELEEDRERRLHGGAGGRLDQRPFDFHERIARGCGNDRIANALCGDLYNLLRIYRRHSGTVLERTGDAYGEHWQVARAILARDPELAESLMRAHVERAARNLFNHLPQVAPKAARVDTGDGSAQRKDVKI
jgi:DNA-binding GntR family transcriptional regulator